MNLAFAVNSYSNTKKNKDAGKYDSYEAVKFALNQVVSSMEKLQQEIGSEEREHHFERSLSSIYFLQKSLDFENGGDLAKNLFKVYEYCREQILGYMIKGTVETLDSAISFIKTITDGWAEIREQI